MKAVLLSFALALVVLTASADDRPVCKVYTCATTALNANEGITGENRICANDTINPSNLAEYVYLEGCKPSNYTCRSAVSLELDQTSKCQAPYTPQANYLLPGNMCTQDSQCISGNCTNSWCLGKEVYEACTDDVECGVNMYCGLHYPSTGDPANVCLAAGHLGGSCNDTMLCGYGLVCVGNQCLNVMSQKNGADVSVGTDTWLACASLTSTVVDGKAVCAAGPVLLGNQLVNQSKSLCTYQIPGHQGTMNSTIESRCAFSQTGMAVCPMGLGDFSSELSLISSGFFSKSNKSCHIDQPLWYICDLARQADKPSNKLLGYLGLLNQNLIISVPFIEPSGNIIDNSPCTKELVTFVYWNLVGGALSNAVSAAAIFLLAIGVSFV